MEAHQKALDSSISINRLKIKMRNPIDIINDVGSELKRLSPNKWSRCHARAKAFAHTYSIQVIYYSDKNEESYPESRGRLPFLFEELRDATTPNGASAFTAATYSLTSDGAFNIDYKYE